MAQTLTRSMRIIVAAFVAIAAASLGTIHVVNAATPPPSRVIPLLLTGVAGTPLTFVVSTNRSECGYGPCLHLQRTSDNAGHFTTLHLPPISKSRGSLLGDLSELIFANSKDGYALINTTKPFVWWATTDGAQTWHPLDIATGETIQQLIPTRDGLYAVIAHCVKEYTCTDFRIARSTLTANRWTVKALPATLSKGGYAFAAFDSILWANRQGPHVPLLFTSRNEGRTFTQSSAPALASVNACGLTPMSANALWAECPTGMLVSFFYSVNAGVHWTAISRYEFAGTGGGAFDPVSSSLSYLDFGPYTGRSKDLYAVTDSGHKMVAIGNLACESTNGLVFSNAKLGLAICQKNGLAASAYLLRTSDGGRVWTKSNLS